MPKEKLYLVKREVWAKDIEEALNKDGKIYSIELAASEYQDKLEMNNVTGFNMIMNKKNGDKKLREK